MALITTSSESRSNDQLKIETATKIESNVALLKQFGISEGVLLVGGTSISDFRLRVAQSHLRHDLLPSYWSTVGILSGGTVTTVRLGGWGVENVAPINGIEELPQNFYDDSSLFPNIGVIKFSERIEPVLLASKNLALRRTIVDLPELMLRWLGFVWSAGDRSNPVLSGVGIPSAALVETAYAMAGVELTPGLASNASCPEAIWQAAKWWHGFYSKAAESSRADVDSPNTTRSIVPEGRVVIRQPSAAAIE
jgi:hypothetical protein